MFLWAGPHQACLRNRSGAVRDLKFGRNERIYEHLGVIMFFRKDPPQTEGRRHAHPRIKLPPVYEYDEGGLFTVYTLACGDPHLSSSRPGRDTNAPYRLATSYLARRLGPWRLQLYNHVHRDARLSLGLLWDRGRAAARDGLK